MSKILHEYLTTRRGGQRGWRSEYDDHLTESVVGDKNAFLASWYSVALDELLDELTEEAIDRIIDRLAERISAPLQVAP